MSKLSPMQIQCKIMQIQMKIAELQAHKDACYNQIMRNQDIYMEGFEFNLGRENGKLEREMNKTDKEIKKLNEKQWKLQCMLNG